MPDHDNPRASPLRFSKEELEDPGVRKAKSKVARAEKQVEKTKKKLPTKKRLQLTQDEVLKEKTDGNALKGADGENPSAPSSLKAADSAAIKKKTVRLHFEETQKKPPSKMTHPVEKTIHTAGDQLHRQVSKSDDSSNVAVEAVLKADDVKTSALQMGEHAYHAHKLKPYKKAAEAEHKLEQAKKSYRQVKQDSEHPELTSNPLSRLQQKRAIRREYAASKAGRKTGANTATQASQATKKATTSISDTAKKVAKELKKRPKVFVLLLLGGMLLLVMNTLQACTPMAQSVLESIVIGTYPATEDDVRAAEQAYAAKERELADEMKNYERYHPGYDAYEVELDPDGIGHDPYVLIAIISAYYDGEEWNIDKAYPVIEKYFKLQYIVTETIETETRYRQEERSDIRYVTDPNTGKTRVETYTHMADVPYTYTTCKVKLENKNLSHLPVVSMSHHTMGMYALYMSTHGNMEGIFNGNPNASALRDPMLYNIPQDTLDSDPDFAKLMEEANKYIGYPYVWGGASPETSFDCSGFVSYVFTNSGYYNTGRRGAKGLFSLCRPVSESEARPGDIVFFEGTMGEKEEGITHCGIYVGNGMMIHCGSPIGYADLSTSYWRKHFYSFGRVPK